MMGLHATISSDYILRSSLPALPIPDISLSEYMFSSMCKHNQASLALIDPNGNGHLTFGELIDRCQTFGRGLVELGITGQDLMLLFADNSLQLVIAYVSAIYLALTVSPVKPANGSFELSQQIDDCAGSVLVIGSNKIQVLLQTFRKYPNMVESIKLIIVINVDESGEIGRLLLDNSVLSGKQIVTFEQVIAKANGKKLEQIPYFPVTNSAVQSIFILYTSGTTGNPKGGILSHRAVIAGFMNVSTGLDLTNEKCALVWHPIGHISGIYFISLMLIDGLSVVCFSISDLNLLLCSVQKFKVNLLYIAPNHATDLARVDYQSKYNLTSLEMIKYTGTSVAANLLVAIRNKYQVNIQEVYGSTEFCGAAENCDYEHFEPGNLGPPSANIEIKIIDLSSGAPLPPLENGEVCLRGPPCFSGYLNNIAKATRAAIDTDGWYHTGDIGYYNHKGCLFLSDRVKEIIKYKEWSIIPSEIENFVCKHSAVNAVCVIGVKHKSDGKLIRAYVELATGKSVTEQELNDLVKDNMGFHKRLRGGVRFLAKFPRSVIGKIDRQYFKQLVKDELIAEFVE